jgi:DNA-binding IscR family transcriptional regulator
MAQIIQALEGPIALTACVEGSGNHCEVECLCPMRGNWLSEVTLADMAASCWSMFGVSEEPAATVERRDVRN